MLFSSELVSHSDLIKYCKSRRSETDLVEALISLSCAKNATLKKKEKK